MSYKKQTRENWTQEQADENVRCLDELMNFTPEELAFLKMLRSQPTTKLSILIEYNEIGTASNDTTSKGIIQ